MPLIETRQFGTVEYSEDSVLDFPEGLPAFDHDTRFILIERPENAPLIFMQSLVHPDLCFITAPAAAIDTRYQLQAPPGELATLGETEKADDLLCLTILTLTNDRPPTANLMAPVIIHRRTRRAKQVIQYESGYSFEHPLAAEQGETC